MTLAELPSWLRYRAGQRPIVIVAPHGGEREREIRRGDGMNDLYTAELCHELARRLDAYAVINEGLDRNDVDLNRISAVVEHAPEMLHVLRDAVTRAGAGAATTPLVLFVHGWNISSLACDIGIGLRESGGELRGTHATVSWATVRSFVEPLRDALAEQGLEGFVGHRYPASGRDNATQLFSGRHVGHDHADVDHLSRLALEGRVDAVQLELSIPLRWPGQHRMRWLAAAEAAVESHLLAVETDRGEDERTAHRRWAMATTPPRASVPSDAETDVAHGEIVQAVLGDGSGLFMGVEPAGPGALAARVCVARPDGELALFVCEAPWTGSSDRFVAGSLDWRSGDCVRYAGPAVLYDTHDAFVDLEGGLRTARIVDLVVDVGLCADRETGMETARTVRVCGQSVEVTPLLLKRRAGRLRGEHGRSGRMTVLGPSGVPVSIEDGRDGPAAAPADIRWPGQIDLVDDGKRIRARVDALGTEIEGVVTVRVPVYRPAPGGGYVHVTFGVAEIVGNRRFGSHALFEVVRRGRASA